jgi:hypothetical protein
MIKRPLNPRFTQAVLEGRKFTTIRENPWPVRVPIMLYNWSGKAYRSPQINVAPVMVSGFWTIRIGQTEMGAMRYEYGMEYDRPLWETEGFDSPEDFDEWFRRLGKPGCVITKHLMRFRLMDRAGESAKHIS